MMKSVFLDLRGSLSSLSSFLPWHYLGNISNLINFLFHLFVGYDCPGSLLLSTDFL